MKTTPVLLAFTLVVGLILCACDANAEGVLGKRYAGFSIGVTKPGDDLWEEIDDSIIGWNASVNMPLNPNVDLGLSIGRAKADGDLAGVDIKLTLIGISGRILYHFSPDQSIDPFLGAGIGFGNSKVEATTLGVIAEEDEDNFAFSIAGGAEINLSEQTALRPGISYVDVDGENDVFAGLSLIAWVSETVFGELGVSYALDMEDVTIAIGVGVSF